MTPLPVIARSGNDEAISYPAGFATLGSQRGIVVILERNRKKFCYNDTTSKILKRDRQNQEQVGNGGDLNGRQVC